MRKCGGCTECCTAIEVEPLGKGQNEKCKKDTGHSCRIYATRPECCRAFTCAWLQGAIPKAHRPDKTGVVIWATLMLGTGGEQMVVARADVRPAMLRVHRQTMRYLRELSEQLPVQIIRGDDCYLWQDGKRLCEWKKNDFISLDIADGKLVNPRVIPEKEILATDADRKRWDDVQEAGKQIMEGADAEAAARKD